MPHRDALRQFCDSFSGAVDKLLYARIRPAPRHTHRCSDVGHPCKRYLYYAIRHWDKAAPVTTSLQSVFETGKLLEGHLEKQFNEAAQGCDPPGRIIGWQMANRDPLLEKYRISGTPDGFLQLELDGKWVTVAVIDIKTANPNLFGRYDDLDDLECHRWTSLYSTQVQMYAFANNLEMGLLAFSNKTSVWQWKLIPVPVDLAYVESVLRKCEEVNLHLDCSEPPKKLNQPFWCKECKFEAECCPALTAEGSEQVINEDPDLEALVSTRQHLHPFAKDFTKVDKRLKSRLIKGQSVIFTNHMIQWKKTASGWRMMVYSTQNSEE